MATHRKFEDTQQDLLIYLENYINKNGYAPSIREIQAYFGWQSTSTAQYHLIDLENKGWITRSKDVNRSIVVKKKSLITESIVLPEGFKDRIKERMAKIDKRGRDLECWHSDADDLLCYALDTLGFEFLTEWFDDHDKWYA